MEGGGGGEEEAEVGEHEHGDREVEVQPVRGGRQETLAVVYRDRDIKRTNVQL